MNRPSRPPTGLLTDEHEQISPRRAGLCLLWSREPAPAWRPERVARASAISAYHEALACFCNHEAQAGSADASCGRESSALRRRVPRAGVELSQRCARLGGPAAWARTRGWVIPNGGAPARERSRVFAPAGATWFGKERRGADTPHPSRARGGSNRGRVGPRGRGWWCRTSRRIARWGGTGMSRFQGFMMYAGGDVSARPSWEWRSS